MFELPMQIINKIRGQNVPTIVSVAENNIMVRWRIHTDIASVMHIENKCYYQNKYSQTPWLRADYENIAKRKNRVGLVAEQNDKILASMVYSVYKCNFVINRIVVDPEEQRRGIGSVLVRHLMDKLVDRPNVISKRNSLLTIVHESNLPIQLLFKSLGWVSIAIIDDTGESAYVMQYIQVD